MNPFEIRHIQTSVQGRYLVQKAPGSSPCPMVIGFHGYGENAEVHLDRMQHLKGGENWYCVSIQALHPFYLGKGKMGANWLTSQDRDFRIKENVEYINKVISNIKKDYLVNDSLVFSGFSQGTAMACRAAVLGDFPAIGVMILGGDIPPEFNHGDLRRIPQILMGRGKEDTLYSNEIWQRDLARIKKAGIPSYICTFAGGHIWSEAYSEAAGKFLKYCYPS